MTRGSMSSRRCGSRRSSRAVRHAALWIVVFGAVAWNPTLCAPDQLLDHGRKRTAPQWLFSERLFKAERVSIFLRGQHISENVTQTLHELHELKKPNSRNLPRKMPERPTQQSEAFEFMCEKNVASMFGFGSSTKRRPNNLVLGRLFDKKILDLFEFGVHPLQPAVLPGRLSKAAQIPALEATPCFVFLGKLWQSDTSFSELKNFIIDCFGVRPFRSVAPASVRRVISVTAHNESSLTLLHCQLSMPEEGGEGQEAALSLVPLAPSLELTLRGSRLADTQVMREALGLGRAMTAKSRERKRERREKAQLKRQQALRDGKERELRAQGIEPTPQDLERAAARKIYFQGISKSGATPRFKR